MLLYIHFIITIITKLIMLFYENNEFSNISYIFKRIKKIYFLKVIRIIKLLDNKSFIKSNT